MQYAYVINSLNSGKKFLRITPNYVRDWIEILSIYDSPMTLRQLDREGSELFPIIAEMRSVNDITRFQILLLMESEEELTPTQLRIIQNQVSSQEFSIKVDGEHKRGRKSGAVSRFTQNNEFISMYKSVQEASAALNIKSVNIYKALHSGGICNGYYWRWVDEKF